MGPTIWCARFQRGVIVSIRVDSPETRQFGRIGPPLASAGAWIAPGTHLNVVGASIASKREIDEEAVVRARLFVDYRASTFAQAGEVIAAIDSGRIGRDHVLAEIGEVLSGKARGRRGEDEITLYRSLGIAAQDLACAAYCLRAAKARGLGVEAPLD